VHVLHELITYPKQAWDHSGGAGADQCYRTRR
jgi:hypothetical protein